MFILEQEKEQNIDEAQKEQCEGGDVRGLAIAIGKERNVTRRDENCIDGDQFH